jgi:patatin-like phospholipase/acyl hydrolase
MADGSRFQILCISGGGYLGLYAAAVLAELEDQAKVPIGDCFDLIAGTSIGGIIALGIAAGTPAAAIRDAISKNGPSIFSSKRPVEGKIARLLELRQNAFKAKYSAAPLAGAIDAILAEDLKIGDLRRRFITPTVNVTKGQPQLFKTPHHETFVRDLKLKARDVALATSAAPTFFPLHEIGAEQFADGGLYANAPDELALHEACHFLNCDIGDVHILSIGTTTSKFSFSHRTPSNMGWLAWLSGQRLFSVMISAQQLNADAVMRHRLGERYLRVDSDRSPEQERNLSMDSASTSATQDLLGLAEASVRHHLPRAPLPVFLSHRAAPAKFFNTEA